MTQEEANLYWSTREHKKWVVSLKSHKNRLVVVKGADGRQTLERVNPNCTMHVSARTAAGAKRTAIENQVGDRMDVVGVRLATAHDLGCVRVYA
jgi:hypothetical protein